MSDQTEEVVQRLMGLARGWCDVERRHCIGRAEVFDLNEARAALESAIRAALAHAAAPEVPADTRDAARYRKLRQMLLDDTFDVGEAYVRMKVVGNYPHESDVDAAVDAAMAPTQSPTKDAA